MDFNVLMDYRDKIESSKIKLLRKEKNIVEFEGDSYTNRSWTGGTENQRKNYLDRSILKTG